MSTTVSAGAPERETAAAEAGRVVSVPVAILLVAIAYGAIAQGAFYRKEVIYLSVILTVAAAALLALRRGAVVAQLVSPVSLFLLGVAASAIVSAWAGGYPAGADGVLLVVWGLLCADLVARTASPRQQETLLTGIALVAVIVAFTGIAGAVMHDLRLATPAGGREGDMQFFRAASTFTYANSTAGFLLVPTMVALARVAAPGAGAAWRLAAFSLTLGLLATVSRGGLVGFAVAIVVLLVIGNRRAIVRENWTVALGVAVAGAGLLPSLPILAQPQPLVAAAGLLAGAGIALVNSRRGVFIASGALAAGAVVALAAVAAVRPDQLARFGQLRFNTDASINDRRLMWEASIRLFLEHPLLGTGPGHFLLRLNVTGPPSYAYFSHNEYLQLLAEQGGVGFLVVVGGVAWALVSGIRERARGGWITAGLVAGLVGLAVHSGFDFLWHVTLIPLVAVVGLSILTATDRLNGGRV
ncbi:MAG: hypothetical protein QOE92_1955 [Chloroflexota bacterium]|nr:hypothetical protein [Chloroflexota bacterium]